MSEAKDLEIEISTDGARALLEIGFDLGVQATLTALGISGEDGPGPPNPFRRGSTEIVEPVEAARQDIATQLERVEADAAANARAHGVTLEVDTYVPANPETGERARLVATLPKNRD